MKPHSGDRDGEACRRLVRLAAGTERPRLQRGERGFFVVAEDRPFSNSPDFPAHYGRFMHPLAAKRHPVFLNGRLSSAEPPYSAAFSPARSRFFISL